MVDILWMAAVGAGALCFGAGTLGWMKAPNSPPAVLFLLAMSGILIAAVTGPLYRFIDPAYSAAANTAIKSYVVAVLMATALLGGIAIVFPINRRISLAPPNRSGLVLIAAILLAIALGSMAEVDYADPSRPGPSSFIGWICVAFYSGTGALSTSTVLRSMSEVNEDSQRSSKIYLTGLWVFVGSGLVYWFNFAVGHPFTSTVDTAARLTLTAGVALSGLIFAYSIASGQMTMIVPTAERLTSASKAKYRLLHRYAYLVEEQKPEFAFKLFLEILKARCWDCEEDESFECESLDCSACKLPCPCRTCKKYKSRAQGIVVTRLFPKEVRTKHYLQTTPIVWLSTVAGKDSLDPAKLSLLTDSLVNFMEKSQNGVVLVEGIEYLVTSNDFHRVLKAIDRWTETAMTSSARLIISLDPRSFDHKEVAMLERTREVVKPDAPEAWKIIPEPI